MEFVRVPDDNRGYLVFDWVTMGQLLSLPLIAFGLVLIAIIASVVSYFVTSLAWRAWIARKRKARVLRARGRKLAG